MDQSASSAVLPSWSDGPTREAILDFIDGADELPVEQRVAVFDNDGTLWCEKPAFIQFLFMLDELSRAVQEQPTLVERPEYRALLDNDHEAQAKLGLSAIAMALVELCAGIGPEEFDRRVRNFVGEASHPRGGVPLSRMRYQPMLELLDMLRSHDFSAFIVTGGGTEFVRAISRDFYGISPEAVVGSLVKYEVSRDGDDRPVLIRTKSMYGDVDEGAAKVSNMQMSLGRRPIFAAGNSPGDSDMLDYAMASDGPSLALLVNHDDADREYAYEGEAATFESTGSFLDTAHASGWIVASMKNDWNQIFPTS